jgi:hypothetical protein
VALPALRVLRRLVELAHRVAGLPEERLPIATAVVLANFFMLIRRQDSFECASQRPRRPVLGEEIEQVNILRHSGEDWLAVRSHALMDAMHVGRAVNEGVHRYPLPARQVGQCGSDWRPDAVKAVSSPGHRRPTVSRPRPQGTAP